MADRTKYSSMLGGVKDPRTRKGKKQRTLASLIDELPTPDINSKDLKTLVLQFILETPRFDDTMPQTVNFNSHKLNALRLLLDINQSEDSNSNEQELLDILAGNETTTSGDKQE